MAKLCFRPLFNGPFVEKRLANLQQFAMCRSATTLRERPQSTAWGATRQNAKLRELFVCFDGDNSRYFSRLAALKNASGKSLEGPLQKG